MAITHEEAHRLKESLGEMYGDRLDACRRLRRYWHGYFYDDADTAGLHSIFRDVNGRQGGDLRVVRNFVHEICVKYQTYLSPLPMIQVPITPPISSTRREQSTRKERILYGLWGDCNMTGVVNEMAWYLPLMGDVFLGVMPDFGTSSVRPLVRSPEVAYPVPSYDMAIGQGLDAIMFSWETDEKWAKRAFPKWDPSKGDHGSSRGRSLFGRRRPQRSNIEVLEYSDKNCFMRWVGGQRVEGVEHNFGFNIFDQSQFIHIPGESFGHGAVEQIVQLNELSNATLSLVHQAILENVYPKLVLIDPQKAPEQIDMGPGGVIPLNAGGGVEWLHPPVQAVREQVGFLGETERWMKELSAMPDVNFGQMSGSIVTGKAINELQGAGTGSTIEMVQGTGIGATLTAFNSKALTIIRRMFASDQIRLGGEFRNDFFDLSPRAFEISFKGSEIIGSTRNVVIFAPAMNMHEKMVMQLQALGANLISKRYARDQIGIPDSEAMDEEIVVEQIQDGMVGTMMAALQQSATEETARSTEEQAVSFIERTAVPKPANQLPPQQDVGQLLGLPPAAGGAPPGPPAGGGIAPGGGPPAAPAGPPGATPGGGGAAPGGEEDLAALLGGAPGEGAPPDMAAMMGGGGGAPAGPPSPELGAPPAATPGAEGPIGLDMAIGMFQGAQGVAGRVFLIGQILAEGSADMIEAAVTEPTDRDAIVGSVPELQGIVHFRVVDGEPDEPWVEVTPGTDPTFGGQEPDLTDYIQ